MLTLFNWAAAANPDGPLPMMAIFFPVRMAGIWGTIHPFSNALSMIAHSMFLMFTGGSLMPNTQAP